METPDLDVNPGTLQIFTDVYVGKNTQGIISKLSRNFTSMNKTSTEYIRQWWEKSKHNNCTRGLATPLKKYFLLVRFLLEECNQIFLLP